MSKLSIVKFAAELVVNYGVGAIVGNTIKNNIAADLSPIKKIGVGIGGLVISSMITTKAVEHVNNQIDQTLENVKEIVAVAEGKPSPTVETVPDSE